MTLSSRTFGVEFELFFEDKDIDALLNANKKYLNLKPSKNDIQWFRDDYEFDHRDNETLKEFIKRRTKEFIEDAYKHYWEDYNLYDLVQTILEERLGLEKWTINDDCSIDGGKVTMEIVTPVLKGEKGLKEITKFLNYFKKYASVNESCGLHVHVGASDFIRSKNNSELFASALLYYSSFESIFDSLVIRNRREDYNDYALPAFDAHKIVAQLSLGNKGHNIQYERYSKLNLCSIDKYGTIEFRQMHGVLDPRVVTNWVKVCTSFVDMVKENYSEWNGISRYKLNKNQQERTRKFGFVKYEGLDILVETTKRKVASRRGYPKGLPVAAINQIKKVNKELFGKKMAA